MHNNALVEPEAMKKGHPKIDAQIPTEMIFLKPGFTC